MGEGGGSYFLFYVSFESVLCLSLLSTPPTPPTHEQACEVSLKTRASGVTKQSRGGLGFC
jgi:hypothetical protein